MSTNKSRRRVQILNHKPQVLFFSIGDSTRSGIAEGFLGTFAGHEFRALSRATQSIEIDLLAREVMREVGIDICGRRGKKLRESLKEHFSCVVTRGLWLLPWTESQ